jgi:Uma2 family endonuclease
MASRAVCIHRFTVEDYAAMQQAGILDDDIRMELVDGVLVEMSQSSPRHASVVEWLTAHFVLAVHPTYRVRVQDGIATGPYDYLSPDLVVIEPIARDKLLDGALLVVEVSHTSRTRDRRKAVNYARIGVPEYWIVDVDRDELLVHRSPVDGAYTHVERFVAGDVVTPLLGPPAVDVAALLAY